VDSVTQAQTATPGCVTHTRGWIGPAEADRVFTTLSRGIPWEQKPAAFGHPTPRLTAWFGSETYTYSGIRNAANPWLPELDVLRRRLETETGAEYDSCLANLYRDGRDSVAWHADDEPELGIDPAIASISLGGVRDFKLRHNQTRAVSNFALGPGDLLLMRAESQSDYQHSVPKRARAEARINLTFRHFGGAP